MLGVIGAGSVDDLFADVPAEARLAGPIAGLPHHASEMAVERHMSRAGGAELSARAASRSSSVQGPIATTFPPASIT